ncbi:4-alpha-glucanotransferase [Desertifilum sp. FACHB-1129]|uniref:4-alpha-glucanotransferase n=1 Tax=Desertifilum tharense IPPAS B-1220 TaxID=1781255 RepID=A0A1E5QD60_9CYAN|nr:MULTISPECIES: 4-alpha-glucanotransferase [Desertifilum]MDA0213515.1 4-alpha-glucanotransferase [Cyanobacteria bacterium FC1]MBD2311416.1 4-alpha-glucanotransferase [Desertifilum sp. FACHB-1129]MBD2321662.1 4-alpha-glucanotransferase [Desertifilum sp. FACHB-866]MBD2331789.1 4-alpha-glucanotransferase [Desertifilum sp. FACHB-868]OEJ72541.1 4-alpha-glucanotransferase [Desertifilum tharense IPPAS B-1220]
MAFSRSSGILLHPTSFPSRFGIGDLGLESFRFIDFLVDSGQQYWQVLPIGPTGYGNSPYMSYAALAGNPLLISPEKLIDEGWLNEGDFGNLPEFPSHTVEYDRVYEVKIPLLKKACENFKANASELQQREFDGFCETKAYWLDDYALFMALKEAHEGASWNTWEADIAKHKPEAIEKWRSQLSDAVYYYKYTQFEFFRQWTELRRYANLRGIQIIGDIPIYVAHDSADVWAHPEAFALDEETGAAALMAGVPPDYFSATGQLWGNPVYNWEHLQQTHFQWWIERFQAMLDYVDLIRIDHFRGFQAYWVVPQGEETAMNGEWVEAPGEEFFKTLNDKLGKLPVLAEDLGVITPEVEALRDQFEFPGMKVLQFAFGDDPGNPFLPFNYPRNCVVYTGTHDNDTTVGWFNQLSDYERDKVQTYLGHFSPDGIQWDLIRLAMSSIANIAIIPVQDLLGLGTDARMNFPSKAEGNWAWRYQSGTLTQELSQRLKQLTFSFGRAPIPQHSESY